MRRIPRTSLPSAATRYLQRKQKEVDGGRSPAEVWKGARKTDAMGNVEHTLQRMAGPRARCMFCEDSHGTDIEHFWPKARYPHRTFVWENLLLVCGGCNSAKGTRFDLDAQGSPLLIDPTAEEPWTYLFYDSHTGNITAKYEASRGVENPKGAYTTDPKVLPLNVEAVTDGRRRTQRNLERAATRFLGQLRNNASSDPDLAQFVAEIRDYDQYGLAEWFFRREGSREPPFRELEVRFPGVWTRIQQALSRSPT